MDGDAGLESRPDVLTANGRVPVEHRFFGLDRRTFAPGLVVIAIFVIFTVIVPAINGAIDYSQQTEAGDVFNIDSGITMDAQAGWDVNSGLLTTDKTQAPEHGEAVLLTNGGVSFSVVPGPFTGSAEDLLGRIEKVESAKSGGKAFHVAGEVQTFVTDDGQTGAAQGYTTSTGSGVVAALVYGSTGLRITYTGPIGSLQDLSDDVVKMIGSISYTPGKAP